MASYIHITRVGRKYRPEEKRTGLQGGWQPDRFLHMPVCTYTCMYLVVFWYEERLWSWVTLLASDVHVLELLPGHSFILRTSLSL